MHEMSIVANLFEIMEENARNNKGKKIVSVKLQVGTLSGVVPELLESCFDMYKRNTIAEEASVEIEKVPLRVKCRRCRKETVMDDFILKCAHCGSTELDTLAGTELILQTMELET